MIFKHICFGFSCSLLLPYFIRDRGLAVISTAQNFDCIFFDCFSGTSLKHPKPDLLNSHLPIYSIRVFLVTLISAARGL